MACLGIVTHNVTGTKLDRLCKAENKHGFIRRMIIFLTTELTIRAGRLADVLSQMSEHVLRRHEANALIGFLGNPGNMRREQDIRHSGISSAGFIIQRF